MSHIVSSCKYVVNIWIACKLIIFQSCSCTCCYSSSSNILFSITMNVIPLCPSHSAYLLCASRPHTAALGGCGRCRAVAVCKLGCHRARVLGACGCCRVGVLYVVSQGLEARVVVILWGSALSSLHGGSALTFLSWCRALWPHHHHMGALWNPCTTTTTKALCLCRHCRAGVQGLS